MKKCEIRRGKTPSRGKNAVYCHPASNVVQNFHLSAVVKVRCDFNSQTKLLTVKETEEHKAGPVTSDCKTPSVWYSLVTFLSKKNPEESH